MSADLHERLHEAMVTAEIPSYDDRLVGAAALAGRRAHRRRRLGAAAAATAVAAAVVTATLLEPPAAPSEVVPVPAAPGPSTTALGTPVDAGLTVSGVPVVLRLHEWPDGSSDLTIGVDGRVPSGADALAPTSLSSTVAEPRGWAVASVTTPDLSTTGTVLVFGYLFESRGVRVVVDGESWRPGSDFTVVDGGGQTSPPGGPFMFALAVDVPALRGLDPRDPRIGEAVGVQRRSEDGSWVEVPRR